MSERGSRRWALSLVLMLSVLSGVSQAEDNKGTARIVLPPDLFAVAGVEYSVYFDNLVLAERSDLLRFEVDCGIGQKETKRWNVTPGADDVGRHAWRVRVFDTSGQLLGQASTKLHVVSRGPGRAALPHPQTGGRDFPLALV